MTTEPRQRDPAMLSTIVGSDVPKHLPVPTGPPTMTGQASTYRRCRNRRHEVDVP